MSCRSSTPPAFYLGEWGSYGGGHGQFGPIGGLATDAAGNVYVVDSSHNRIEKFTSSGEFVTTWGHTGGELGQFKFGSSQNYTQPPGGGIAVAGEYVYVADSGNNRIERFNLSGGEPLQWGSRGAGAGQFYYPRGVAANAGEVLVADDDNHRIERFSPTGEFQGAVGSYGAGPGQFGFPYGVALDAGGQRVRGRRHQPSHRQAEPRARVRRRMGRLRLGARPARVPARAGQRPGGRHVCGGHRQRPHPGVRSDGAYLRTIGALRARAAARSSPPRGLAVDPTGRLLVADTDGNRIETFAQGGGALSALGSRAGGHASGFAEPSGIAIDPRGSVYVADTGAARLVRLWGEGTYLSELGGPADLGGAPAQRRRLGGGVRRPA